MLCYIKRSSVELQYDHTPLQRRVEAVCLSSCQTGGISLRLASTAAMASTRPDNFLDTDALEDIGMTFIEL